jgi:hypothetical protein
MIGWNVFKIMKGIIAAKETANSEEIVTISMISTSNPVDYLYSLHSDSDQNADWVAYDLMLELNWACVTTHSYSWWYIGNGSDANGFSRSSMGGSTETKENRRIINRSRVHHLKWSMSGSSL